MTEFFGAQAVRLRQTVSPAADANPCLPTLPDSKSLPETL